MSLYQMGHRETSTLDEIRKILSAVEEKIRNFNEFSEPRRVVNPDPFIFAEFQCL